MDKSLHEIYWRLNKIGDRINTERSFKASLHGIELKNPAPGISSKRDLTDDEKKAMAIALERAKSRKRSEYGN